MKNSRINFKKPIDKSKKICYHVIVPRGTEKFLKDDQL